MFLQVLRKTWVLIPVNLIPHPTPHQISHLTPHSFYIPGCLNMECVKCKASLVGRFSVIINTSGSFSLSTTREHCHCDLSGTVIIVGCQTFQYHFPLLQVPQIYWWFGLFRDYKTAYCIYPAGTDLLDIDLLLPTKGRRNINGSEALDVLSLPSHPNSLQTIT